MDIQAAFCTICSKYGHYTRECSDTSAAYYRKPQFMEQLIPHFLRKHYNIQTLTPIESNPHIETEYVNISDIKQALEERGIEVSSNQDVNRRKLERWAIENKKKICYKKNEDAGSKSKKQKATPPKPTPTPLSKEEEWR